MDPLLSAVEEYLAEQEQEAGPAEAQVEWLPEHFARRMSELNADAAAAEARCKAIVADAHAGFEGTMAEIRAKIGGLKWKYLNDLHTVVRTMLDGKKSRSINTAYGKIGFRTRAARETMVVADPAVAYSVAVRECPQAVIPTVKLSELPPGFPGTRMEKHPATEVFYCGSTELETREPDVPLPANRQTLAEFFGIAFTGDTK